MKKMLFLLKKMLFLLCSVVLAVGCADAQNSLVATATGVGPIQLGMPADKVPASVAELYDAVETKTIEEEDMGDVYVYNELHFTLAGEPVMVATAGQYNGGAIELIEVVGTNVKTAKGVGAGTTVADMFAKGATTFMYNSGTLYFVLDGIRFTTAEGVYSASGNKKLDDSYRHAIEPAMTAEDFVSGTTIKSIEIFE